MGKKLANILKGEIVSSIFYVLFGLCLILMPVQTLNIIWKVVFGLVLIGDGCYHLYLYMMEKESVTILDLFSGVISIVLGGFLFSTPQIVVRLLTLLLGAFVLVDSIWTLRGCIKLKKRNNGLWKAFLVVSLVFIVLGAAIMINPFKLVTDTEIFAGWVFLCNGLIDFVFLILLKKGMKEEAVAEGVSDDDTAQVDSNLEASDGNGMDSQVVPTANTEVDTSAVLDEQSAQTEGVSDTAEAQEEAVDQPVVTSMEEKAKPEEEPLEEWKD